MLPGATLVGDGDGASRACTATPARCAPGDLFVALQRRALRRPRLPRRRRKAAGAVAALAERGLADAGLPGLEVADTLLALRRAGRAPGARRFELPLIAVTGSNGKTTVTQMIAAILRAWLRRRARWRPQATSTTTSACR